MIEPTATHIIVKCDICFEVTDSDRIAVSIGASRIDVCPKCFPTTTLGACLAQIEKNKTIEKAVQNNLGRLP